MAMASPAVGQRSYPLLLDPEPPRYLQTLSGPEPPPPPHDRSTRRCVPGPLSTAPGAHEGRSARRTARGNLEPPPRPSRPARPLRPGLQQRLRRRPGARPRDVRSIFEQPQDPRVPAERGEGHSFAKLVLPVGPGWCDLCGREVLRQALRCATLGSSSDFHVRKTLYFFCLQSAAKAAQCLLSHPLQLAAGKLSSDSKPGRCMEVAFYLSSHFGGYMSYSGPGDGLALGET
ncbi:Ras association domain-containing protein 5 [Saguinus oedipus]|uniref:Ras association domain-containing protein 5 n=1 Tax=Saguinus oedipus TaxID=9490 RepID=A0ABQ9TNR1_SAGOE|nr:Ras association domain-containing protein 5 [Saguinus oedipus]